MFFAISVTDNIPLDCSSAGNEFSETLIELKKHISAKYIDKVLKGHGLCLHLLSIYKTLPRPVLTPNDGRPCFKTYFQIIVFKPLPRQILRAQIVACDPTGIKVSTGFFTDIRIPSHLLQEGCVYDDRAKLWAWKIEADDGSGLIKPTELFCELDAYVRVRVVDVIFSAPSPPNVPTENETAASSAKVAPMLVVAAMNEPGLGIEDWW